jgi:23S rRNA (adenine1618-N6)-methyltransferase
LKKPENQRIKIELHPRNKHRENYDFKLLIKTLPDLAAYVFTNKYQRETIDFADPHAVKILNKALLLRHYKVKNWDIPEGFLTPPIPGRADYIHYMADLLAEFNEGKIPTGVQVKCLDIGVGANCIYPLIAASEYGWSVTGSDVQLEAIDSAAKIIDSNPELSDLIQIKHQVDSHHIFKGIIEKDDFYDLTICNPPFHASAEEAMKGTSRKIRNLNKKEPKDVRLNFGGVDNELWHEGGEEAFILKMIAESKNHQNSVAWFSCLLSKEENTKKAIHLLKALKVKEMKVIAMATGNKKSRIIAWTFHLKQELEQIAAKRYKK